MDVIETIKSRGHVVPSIMLEERWDMLIDIDVPIFVSDGLTEALGYTSEDPAVRRQLVLAAIESNFNKGTEYFKYNAKEYANFLTTIDTKVRNNRANYEIKKLYPMPKTGPGRSPWYTLIMASTFKELFMLVATPKAKEMRKFFCIMTDTISERKRDQQQLEVSNHVRMKAELEMQLDMANMTITTITSQFTSQLKDAESRCIVYKERCIKRTKLVGNGYIYVAASPSSAKASVFKIGRTEHRPIDRLASMKIGYAAPETAQFYAIFLVHDSVKVEALVHKFLDPWRYESGKEMFRLELPVIISSINATIEGYNQAVEYHNDTCLNYVPSNEPLVATPLTDDVVRTYVGYNRKDTDVAPATPEGYILSLTTLASETAMVASDIDTILQIYINEHPANEYVWSDVEPVLEHVLTGRRMKTKFTTKKKHWRIAFQHKCESLHKSFQKTRSFTPSSTELALIHNTATSN